MQGAFNEVLQDDGTSISRLEGIANRFIDGVMKNLFGPTEGPVMLRLLLNWDVGL